VGLAHKAIYMTENKAGMAGYPRCTPVPDSCCLESLCTSFRPMCLLPSPVGLGCRQRTNLDTGNSLLPGSNNLERIEQYLNKDSLLW